MIEQVGGLRGSHIFADEGIIKLLNKMAGGTRTRTLDNVEQEERFDLRTAPLSEWKRHIEQRQSTRRFRPPLSIANFTRSNVIRLGSETTCAHCKHRNWHSLTATDCTMYCERCLKDYDFPQADLKESQIRWSYRVVGPFSVPDFGRGSYGAILSLAVLQNIDSVANHFNFSTAMNLRAGKFRAEIDFLGWLGERSYSQGSSPTTFIGEAKSFATGDAVTPHDLSKLKAVASLLPDCAIVISVMRNAFSKGEVKRLRTFATWTRRPNRLGAASNPLLLLTANELFGDFSIGMTWKKLGSQYEQFSDYSWTSSIGKLADATQQIYLGMTSYAQWRDEKLKKRVQRWREKLKRK